jgi:hypothetical protein
VLPAVGNAPPATPFTPAGAIDISPNPGSDGRSLPVPLAITVTAAIRMAPATTAPAVESRTVRLLGKKPARLARAPATLARATARLARATIPTRPARSRRCRDAWPF